MKTLQMSEEMSFLLCSFRKHYGNFTCVSRNVIMVMVCSYLNPKHYAFHGTLGI
jgi:hypothetical protein